ncbi:hypothetical protein JOQ06_001561 [Pogonophryne albipinna]|uniref:Uncharacterized protein n=1 Tax=Pogonophryne albipinna TaxID=1090488 RepID=A0AAD6B308_9TELE|nr:hypothetical protein JOQ06_001561 [Pogonophryne albipinna]
MLALNLMTSCHNLTVQHIVVPMDRVCIQDPWLMPAHQRATVTKFRNMPRVRQSQDHPTKVAALQKALGNVISRVNQEEANVDSYLDAVDQQPDVAENEQGIGPVGDNRDAPRDFDGLEKDRPIYDEAETTKGTLVLLAIGYVLRHGRSGYGLSDLLSLLNVAMPGCVPATKYFLDKSFFRMSDFAEQHFYCPECQAYLGINIAGQCAECEQEFTKEALLAKDSFFLVMPLSKQLTDIMQREEIQDALAGDQRQCLSDGKEGSCYRELGDWVRQFDIDMEL